MTQDNGRKVTLAVARVIEGKTHKADSTVTLPDLEARDLIRAGLAREPDKEKSPPAASRSRRAATKKAEATNAAPAEDPATATAAATSTAKGK